MSQYDWLIWAATVSSRSVSAAIRHNAFYLEDLAFTHADMSCICLLLLHVYVSTACQIVCGMLSVFFCLVHQKNLNLVVNQ